MRIAVAGLGLIGGSLALAATAEGHDVAGFDSDPDAGVVGRERGAVSAFSTTLSEALDGAELAFVCGPVAELPALVTAAASEPSWSEPVSTSPAEQPS